MTNNGSLTGVGTSGTGGNGVYIQGTLGSVTNSGNISATGSGSAAVALGAGGTVTNNSTGRLTGNGFGAFVTGTPGAVTNSGSISGIDGVTLAKGGSVTNNTSASIAGVTIGVFSEAGISAPSLTAAASPQAERRGPALISRVAVALRTMQGGQSLAVAQAAETAFSGAAGRRRSRTAAASPVFMEWVFGRWQRERTAWIDLGSIRWHTDERISRSSIQ